MRTIKITVVLSFLVAVTARSQTLLNQRIRRYRLSPEQSFIMDTTRKLLVLVNLVNPDQFRQCDSFSLEAQRKVGDIREKVVAADWNIIKSIEVLYVNRYCYDLDQAFIFRFYTTDPKDTSAIQGPVAGISINFKIGCMVNVDSLPAIRFYRKAYKYPLAVNEFFIRGDQPQGSILSLYKNVDIKGLLNKTDSLKELSKTIAKELYFDVIREDCSDFKRVSVTFKDRHFSHLSLGWEYRIDDCYFDDRAINVSRLN